MYTEYILKMAPKALSQVDRDRHSKNYGDCDRNHWHLKISRLGLRSRCFTRWIFREMYFTGKLQ